jgi:hypothetical protein
VILYLSKLKARKRAWRTKHHRGKTGKRRWA